jgi:phage repressor protein C with HTH and peptisase S24 domain
LFFTTLLAALGAYRAVRRWRPFPVRVTGPSMEPTLHEGDLLAVIPIVEPRTGDVVVVRARGIEMVKRVTSIDDGVVHLRGDNRGASTDLYVDAEDVEGVVVARYWPRPKKVRA